MSEQRTILLLAERRGDELDRTCRELVTAAKNVARECGACVAALLAGGPGEDSARELAGMGVDKVYVVDDRMFSIYAPEPYVELLAQACSEIRPTLVLMAHSDLGRDLAPRLAFRLGAALGSNCVDLAFDPVSVVLRVTRPVFGGKAHGCFSLLGPGPQVVTLAQKVFEPAATEQGGHGEILPFVPTIDRARFRTSVVERVVDSDAVRLEDASVVVSGGRGIGSAEEFATLRELAFVLGGCVGASRAAVDSGWVPSNLQVGLTGSIVSPKVYLAIGISGAAQHMAGCSSAETIIAINKDPEAPIFQRASHGAVADWREVVPALIEKCRANIG